jgi:hypothetical protein
MSRGAFNIELIVQVEYQGLYFKYYTITALERDQYCCTLLKLFQSGLRRKCIYSGTEYRHTYVMPNIVYCRKRTKVVWYPKIGENMKCFLIV